MAGGVGGREGSGGDQDDADLGAVGAVVAALDAPDDARAGGADGGVARGAFQAEASAAEAGGGLADALVAGGLPVAPAGLGLRELVAEVGGVGAGGLDGRQRLEACGVAVSYASDARLSLSEPLAERDGIARGRGAGGLGGGEIGLGLFHVQARGGERRGLEDGDGVADCYAVALSDEKARRLARFVGEEDAADGGPGGVVGARSPRPVRGGGRRGR